MRKCVGWSEIKTAQTPPFLSTPTVTTIGKSLIATSLSSSLVIVRRGMKALLPCETEIRYTKKQRRNTHEIMAAFHETKLKWTSLAREKQNVYHKRRIVVHQVSLWNISWYRKGFPSLRVVERERGLSIKESKRNCYAEMSNGKRVREMLFM